MKIKVWVLFLIVASFTAAAGMVNSYYLNIIEKDLKHMETYIIPLIQSTHEIQHNSTQAHVLIEEILAGDTAEQIDQVWSMLDKSEQYALTLKLENKGQLKGLHSTQEEIIKNKVDLLLERIIDFRKAAKERFDYVYNSGAAGSDDDQEYDELYEIIQQQLNVLIGSHMKAEYVEIVRNAGIAKYYLANGHLFLEELLSGDNFYTIEEILGDFRQAKILVKAVIDSEAPGGIASNLDSIITTSQQRYVNEIAFNKKVAELDVRFDASFDQFYRDINATQEAIHGVIGKEFAHLNEMKAQAQKTTILIIIAGFLLALIFARNTIKSSSFE